MLRTVFSSSTRSTVSFPPRVLSARGSSFLTASAAEVVRGSPGDVLLEQVRRHDIDHIVIGHTERGALARWLLGSVSSDVLERAHVPVTVVR